jgi:hypothetical protein
MATIGSKFVDLIDVYKQMDGKGQFVEVIEMLSEMNPILDDALAVECNSGTKHLHSIRTGLPTPTWGKLYAGIPQSKSTKAQVEDTTGFVESLSSVDTRLLSIAPNPGALRLSEAMAHLEAMNQEVASRIFYGNTVDDPEQFMGLAPRFNSLSAPNGGQIIDAGGTGSDNTSIWFVTWGPNQCQLLYPKGTMAGVNREDKGEQRVLDGSGNPYYVKEEKFSWHVGLSVEDWRYVTRIANVNVSNMIANPTNVDGANHSLYHFMRKAFYKIQNRRIPQGRLAIYCNRDVMEALDALGTNSGGNDVFVRLKPEEIQGKQVLTYRGIPVRECDAILNTESRVV